MQNKSKWFGWAISFVAIAAFTEAFIGLELVPIVMLMPQSVLLFNFLAALAVVVLCVFALCAWLWGRLRFSTQTLLFCMLLVAWPVARLANQVRKEVGYAETQRTVLSELETLSAKQADLGGRYNDGRHDFPVQIWLYRNVLRFLDPNEIRYEVTYLKNVDLSDTAVTDEHMDLLVATGTIEVLDLSRTAVTETGIQQLAKLESLRQLRLSDVVVAEETLENLKAELTGLVILRD